MIEDKQAIRSKILNIRNKMSETEIKSKSTAIIQQVLKTPEYEEADNILLYADFNHEVMTKELFDYAVLNKKRVYFPKCSDSGNKMEFYQIVSVKQLSRGKYGILEPPVEREYCFSYRKEEDTLAIIPGVAFDMQGYRIGYGKGFYDSYLKNRMQMTFMALAYSNQIVETIPHERHDIRMDKVVTEEIIYSFLRI